MQLVIFLLDGRRLVRDVRNRAQADELACALASEGVTERDGDALEHYPPHRIETIYITSGVTGEEALATIRVNAPDRESPELAPMELEAAAERAAAARPVDEREREGVEASRKNDTAALAAAAKVRGAVQKGRGKAR